ncbi:MAG: hypothetical protein M3011_01045 [Actinomycetota bacterium]|nr:hypothetical protein [Actinomycetota bacterium]
MAENPDGHEWLPATWADVRVGTVVRDVDGGVGEVMSIQRQSRDRPRGHALEIEVLARDGAWTRKAVEATNFGEVGICP